MTLSQKILQIYPELSGMSLFDQGILLQNDSDGRGDYIAKWNHPTLAQPTQEDLDGISS
jgi:hypothetical protein